MEIEADTAEELRGYILLAIAQQDKTYTLQLPYCRTIAERRALGAAIMACRKLHEEVKALRIRPKNGDSQCT